MRRTKVPAGMFGNEAELCESLVICARAAGYRVHAECGPWDLLIVCRETGDQLGVQGKLRPSVSVLSQAVTSLKGSGPELHAVLVPHATREFRKVAALLNIHVFSGVSIEPEQIRYAFDNAPRWDHKFREWTPDVEIVTPAGTPSPRKITPWKIGAVKLCLRAREHGFVTRADLRELELDVRWWLHRRFGRVLERRVVDGVAQRGEYVLRDPSSPLVPDLRWPEIVDALKLAQSAVLKGPRLRTRRAPDPPRRSTLLPPAPSCQADNDVELFDEDRIVASGNR